MRHGRNIQHILCSIVLVGACSAPQDALFSRQSATDPDAGANESGELLTSEAIEGGNRATVSANASTTQILDASNAINGASVSFPPGSLAFDADVSALKGSDFESEERAELGLGEDGDVELAGDSLVVSSEQSIDPSAPFGLQLPVDTALALTELQATTIVFYATTIFATGETHIGFMSGNQLTFSDGKVHFETPYFGRFQPFRIFVPEPSVREVKTNTEASQPIASKATQTATASAPRPSAGSYSSGTSTTTSDDPATQGNGSLTWESGYADLKVQGSKDIQWVKAGAAIDTDEGDIVYALVSDQSDCMLKSWSAAPSIDPTTGTIIGRPNVPVEIAKCSFVVKATNQDDGDSVTTHANLAVFPSGGNLCTVSNTDTAGNCEISSNVPLSDGAIIGVVGNLKLTGTASITGLSNEKGVSLYVGGNLILENAGAESADILLNLNPLEVWGDIQLHQNATISSDGLGHPGGVSQASGDGLGGGMSTATVGIGASHGASGGAGGAVSNFTLPVAYGFDKTPIHYGSGGGASLDVPGGAGGGLIRIHAQGAISFGSGAKISAKGIDGSGGGNYGGGGGSGGSVWITARTMSNATIDVLGGAGGSGTTSVGGAGANGRIAVYTKEDSTFSFTNGASSILDESGEKLPRYVAFVTSQGWNGLAANSLENGKNHCDVDAHDSGQHVYGRWRPFLGTNTKSPKSWNLGGEIYNLNGMTNQQLQRVAMSGADLFENGADAQIRYFLSGSDAGSSSLVWTGMTSNGDPATGNTCENWSTASGSPSTGAVGNGSDVSKISYSHDATCDTEFAIYCFSY